MDAQCQLPARGGNEDTQTTQGRPWTQEGPAKHGIHGHRLGVIVLHQINVNKTKFAPVFLRVNTPKSKSHHPA